MTDLDLDAHARALMDANLYVTLGTADAAGTAWVSPVYYATADYAEIFWVSKLDAQHSRNIATRPALSMVIFDSQVPTYHGRAVYLSGTAAELAGRDLDRGVEIYPGDATRGASTVSLEDVTAPSDYRFMARRSPRRSCCAPENRGSRVSPTGSPPTIGPRSCRGATRPRTGRVRGHRSSRLKFYKPKGPRGDKIGTNAQED